jgi:O-antigen ligase
MRLAAFGGLLLLVALAGGGSRSDIPSLLILRPAAVLFSAYAFLAMTAEQFRRVKFPLLAVIALMVLALLQLVPLPSAIWVDLPHRGTVAEFSALAGVDDLPRPLSLDPNRTWNTFFALFVPLAAIGLVGIQAEAHRRMVVPMLVGIALLSAVVGTLQALGGDWLYLYRVTHDGYPVGLFSNRNHQSIMLLWLMLAGCWLATTADLNRYSAGAVIAGAVALVLVVFPLLVLTGSRAGLLLTAPTLLLSGWLLFRSTAMREVLRRAPGRKRLVVPGLAAILIAPLLFIFGALAISGRDTALSRLFEVDASEDLRWSYLSIIAKMARDFLPFGSGFGSFESVFNMYEPAEMLTRRYMNQAHNDPLQLVIEGGLPAVAILLAALAWLALAVWQVGRQGREGQLAAAFYSGSIALWLAASVVDYPLRTPLAAMLVAALTAQLCFRSTAPRSGRSA